MISRGATPSHYRPGLMMSASDYQKPIDGRRDGAGSADMRRVIAVVLRARPTHYIAEARHDADDDGD